MPDAAPLHVVSGKGGTGKTTVSLALAHVLARTSGDTLVAEVEARHGLTEAAGRPPVPLGEERHLLTDAHEVRVLSVDPGRALTDYLESTLRLGLAGKVLERTGFIDFATELAPGLHDALLTGKLYQVCRRRAKGEPNAVAAVVLDAPPTGRIERFLTAGDALAEVVPSGPVHAHAQTMMTLLRSATTRVHLVTTLTEMAVTETLATLDALRRHGIAAGRVIATMVLTDVPALPAGLDEPRLLAAHAAERAAVAAQRPWADALSQRLATDGLPPLVTLPFLADDLTPTDVRRLADALRPQWVAA